MGCVTSKKDINDLHPNVFQVSNVDDLGNPLSSGQLEVTVTELVLHQRGKPPIRWPLKSLRRYGYDSQVFSFEAGRRCPTGSGIYAFSCHRAEQLFNFVQAHAQIRNEDTMSRDNGTPTPGGGGSARSSSHHPQQEANYLEPTPTVRHTLPRLSIHNGPSSRLSSVGSSNGCQSPSSPLTANNNYANEEIFRVEEKCRSPPVEQPPTESYQNVPPVSPGVCDVGTNYCSEELRTPVYMNVMPGSGGEAEEDEPRHCYANLTPGDLDPARAELPPATPPPVLRSVNYIVLDLDGGQQPAQATPPSPESWSPPPPPPPPPPHSNNNNSSKLSEGYVTIDFDRTVALSHSVNPSFENDSECLRKTRHNSTINDLGAPPSRQSASFSD